MSMIDDTAAIEQAVMLYVDGSAKNDNTLVKQAFDGRARLFGGMMDGRAWTSTCRLSCQSWRASP